MEDEPAWENSSIYKVRVFTTRSSFLVSQFMGTYIPFVASLSRAAPL